MFFLNFGRISFGNFVFDWCVMGLIWFELVFLLKLLLLENWKFVFEFFGFGGIWGVVILVWLLKFDCWVFLIWLFERIFDDCILVGIEFLGIWVFLEFIFVGCFLIFELVDCIDLGFVFLLFVVLVIVEMIGVVVLMIFFMIFIICELNLFVFIILFLILFILYVLIIFLLKDFIKFNFLFSVVVRIFSCGLLIGFVLIRYFVFCKSFVIIFWFLVCLVWVCVSFLDMFVVLLLVFYVGCYFRNCFVY